MAYCWWVDLLGTGDLSRSELCLLIVLKRYCREKGTCCPSATTLGKELGREALTRQWVNNLLLGLEQKGLIQLERRKGQPHIITLIERKRPANSTLHPPANSSLQVDEANDTNLQTGCQLHFAGPANSSLHKVDIDKKKKGNSPSASVSPKKETDPRVKVLIDYYCTAYEPKFRVKYKVFAKDGKHFKDLLIDYPPNRLKACVDLFLDDPDEWLKDKRTIGVFFGRINQYLVQTASQQATLTPAAQRPLQ